MVNQMLLPSQQLMSMSCYPMMGVPGKFCDLDEEPGGPSCNSLYTPDCLMGEHKRFQYNCSLCWSVVFHAYNSFAFISVHYQETYEFAEVRFAEPKFNFVNLPGLCYLLQELMSSSSSHYFKTKTPRKQLPKNWLPLLRCLLSF